MNGIVKAKGLNWPLKLNFLEGAKLLGPSNRLGSFRWYCKLELGLGSAESGCLSCFKIDSFLRVVAVGRLGHSCASRAEFESERPRLVAKCIRDAKLLASPAKPIFILRQQSMLVVE